MIHSRQQVEQRKAVGVAPDRLPVRWVSPTLVEVFQRFFIRAGHFGKRQRPCGFGQQAAIAGQFHVQAFGQIAQGLIFARFAQIFAERLVYRFARQTAPIPGFHRHHGPRQTAYHFWVTDAFVEQCDDWHQKHQQQEQHQRRNQRLGFPAIEPLGTRQALLEGGAVDLVRGNGDGHG